MSMCLCVYMPHASGYLLSSKGKTRSSEAEVTVGSEKRLWINIKHRTIFPAHFLNFRYGVQMTNVEGPGYGELKTVL